MDRNKDTVQQRGRPVSGLEAAHANEYFEQFVNATSLKHILGYYRGLIDCLHLKPNVFNLFYPKLRANLNSWRAKALLKKIDARASHKCYHKSKLANNTRVLIIGGGPCGMRTAIEAQLLGAKVVVVEKRDRFSRNNVLHLWPFVIEDLRMLGAKKFFGKFCAGAIDHISIRQLQCILIKVALLLGVEVHTEVGFEKLIEPSASDKTGWRAEFKPSNHPVSHYEFDVVIGADGKRNTLQGFSRKEFRGKLAIAITANFINKKTEAEARVEEISGVAFIFNQKFFKDLLEETRIDLENIVYYKDDTHYFVMTAKKASLIEKGVIKQDIADTEKLLAPENVDREALQQYAIEAANFSTNYQMPDMEFAVNHYGQPDIAMFDFTSMYAAENASKVLERHGCRLLMILVGDSLLEPFWPTGSGCARGFLSALDAAWAIRSWTAGNCTPLDVIAERESIYRLLAQTTPDNLNKDWKSYTLDPTTRYPNLNKGVVLPHQVVCLFDTDNSEGLDRMKKIQERPIEVPKKRKRGNVDNEVLLNWLQEQLCEETDLTITDIGSIYKDGKVLCAIIHHYRPDLLDYSAIKYDEPAKNNQIAIDILEKELGIPPVMTGEEITKTEDYLTTATYLTEVYDIFRGEIPHVKHPKLKFNSRIPKALPVPSKIKCSPAVPSIPNDRVCAKCYAGNPVKIHRAHDPSKKSDLSVKSRRRKLSSSGTISPRRRNSQKKDNEMRFLYVRKTRPRPKEAVMCRCREKSKRNCDLIKDPIADNIRVLDKSSSKNEIENTELIHKDFPTESGDAKNIHQVRRHPIIPENAITNLVEYKRDKLKSFMANLLLKRKQSILRRFGNLTAIPETRTANVEIKTNFIETSVEKKMPKDNLTSETFIVDINPPCPDIPQFEPDSSRIYNESIDNDTNTEDCKTIYNNAHFNCVTSESPSKIPSKQSLHTTSCKNPLPNVLKVIRSKEDVVKIRLIEKKARNKFTIRQIEFESSLNQLTISSKMNLTPKHLSLGKSTKVSPKLTKSSSLEAMDKTFLKDLGRQVPSHKCRLKLKSQKCKFLSKSRRMLEGDGMADQSFCRVSNWISNNDFYGPEVTQAEADNDTTVTNSKLTDITSVSRAVNPYQDIKIEEMTDCIKFCDTGKPIPSVENFTEVVKSMNNRKPVKGFSKFSQYSPFQNSNMKSTSAPPAQFSVIVEGEEPVRDLPESTKLSDLSYKTIKTTTANQYASAFGGPTSARPSSRHKRHAEPVTSKASTIDKKTRKRRTLEKIGASVEERQKTLEEISGNRAERQNRRRQQRKLQTEQFIKSMQMLQANAKPDSQPFEDYSLFVYRQTAPKFEDRVKDLEKQFTYIPDHETKVSVPTVRPGGTDEDLAARIKSLENKWRDPQPVDKKPKDLMRAIGKIETSDWNIKEIEKKIQENKLGKPKTFDKEKVPKWSKEQFIARQSKMEKKHYTRQDSAEAKFAEIDKSIKNLDQKLKEGTIRELGTNKVATLTEKLVSKVPAESKQPEKTQVVPRAPVVLPAQNASEICHFCQKRVYLMEKLSAEGRFFHHGCFKCQYCNAQLRLGSYAFDRDGMYGFKFFCQNHFGMVGQPPRATRRPTPKITVPNRKSPEKRIPGIAGVDLLDRVQTPERIEFANLSTDLVSSDQEERLSQMDEDEWTDKNFGPSCAEVGDSDDDDSSSLSDTDSDDEDAYDDALEEPATKEGTMKWAERWKNSYSRRRHDSDSDGYSSSDQWSYENSSDDDNADTATEGEEEIRARELRKQEVRVEPPVVQTDTGTDTEVVSDESSSESSSEIQNSATEISTDSEFAQDDPTPTREVPSIMLNDFHVTKVRGSGGNHAPKRIQVTTGYLQRPSNGRPKRPSIELNLKPLVPHTPLVKKPAPVLLPRTQGYALNRTQSTGGIAAKVSLELKKKYLLGESTPGAIQKSGSASTLDTTFKTFHSKISDCQKLLKPAPEISASMQTFCNKLNERKSPILSPQSSIIFPKVPEPTKEVEESSKPTDSVFVNESEGRPRSPVHETSIIVPQIDWSKKEQSLSSDSLATSSSEDDVSSKPKFDNIPRVEVHIANDVEEKEDIPLDSLLIEVETPAQSESTKSITSEKKSLNQPKQLPNLETLLPDIHNALHMKNQRPEILEIEALKNSSGISSPESGGEQATAALTETELSDWARDEAVSDGFEHADFESEKQDKERDPKVSAKIAKIAELDDLGHVCSNEKAPVGLKNKIILTEAMNNILGSNLDNIEFMDTGTETSSEDGQVDSQNGYVLFKNEDEFAEDSLNPNINEIVEATNLHILEKDEIKNSGYCVIAEEVKQAKRNDLEDDSLLNVETGTTTEENTCSDSTVKNVTEITVDKKQVEAENNNISEVAINNEQNKNEQKDSSQKDTIEFSEHCQRLQSKIEFGNVKDSIDIRKSRRKSKSEALQKPDLIQEETTENQKDVTLKLTPTPHTPDILYRKDIIQKERDVNQKLVQEMVMNKMLAEHKSLERKKRNRSSQSPYSLTKSATTDIVSQINLNNLDANRQSTYSTSSSTYNTPDVLLSTNLIPLQNSKSVNTMPELNMSTDSLSTPAKDQNRPKSLYAPFTEKVKPDIKNSPVTAMSVPDDTPKAPPRQHRSVDDVNRKLEKLKQCVKARGKENENQALLDSERNNSWLYSNDNLNKKKNTFKRSKSGDCGSQTKICSDRATSVPVRTKSIPELQNKAVQIHDIDYETERKKICKSDPNILESEQKNKKKSKDRERRKSITKIITSLFTKKSPNSGSKGLFSKLSPKSKDMSKSCANLDLKEAVLEEPVRRKSLSEANIPRNIVTPPPIPPLPTNYSVKATDESSEGEYENRGHGHSSCDTLDQSGFVENSMSSLTSRRSCKSKKAIRYAQRSIAKRHRMAQEIQRKLEETEVKTKELEMRGVEVEKALRGEDGGECSKDESDLLQEWFDLMRDRTELRRYERELSIRAQELELEDRHARLQHELRDRLENEGAKKEEDLKKEKSIIKEMMDIVAQRDSLVTVIEEERLRCTTEDRDLEEQMLAKGLRLTPIKTSPEK